MLIRNVFTYTLSKHSACFHRKPPVRVPLTLEVVRGMADTSGHDESAKKKPNLRQAPANSRPKQVILAACVLAALYMYPSILRPLFGIGASDGGADVSEKVKEINKLLAEHRPSNMPDWTSPFAPKRKD